VRDVTVIGAGPVGLSAAFWAGMREASVQIVEALPQIGGQLTALYPDKPIYDVPGHPFVLARVLVELHRRQTLEQFDVPVHLETTAVGLRDEGEHLVLETDRGELQTRTLIVAAGHGRIEPRTLPELDGVSYLPPSPASLAGKRVVIVGGGDSACDWALLLQDVAAEVHLVHRRERFRALEKTVRELHESSVALHVPATIARRTGDGVELSDGTFIACDAVVPQLGFRAALGPVADWMAMPRVWACGDVASYEGKLKLIASGYAEAATAVAQAVKLLRPEMPLQPGYSTDTGVPGQPAPA
jgi:ferredoxin/flavodoxin---NADP+ reductase